MSITFDPATLLYAAIEYLKSSKHIYNPVDTEPKQDGQYRLVCLAINSDEAWRVVHLLRALSDGRYWYSVCVAEPESFPSDDGQGMLDNNQIIEPLNPTA
jgi:hypothetical protein